MGKFGLHPRLDRRQISSKLQKRQDSTYSKFLQYPIEIFSISSGQEGNKMEDPKNLSTEYLPCFCSPVNKK